MSRGARGQEVERPQLKEDDPGRACPRGKPESPTEEADQDEGPREIELLTQVSPVTSAGAA